MPHIDSTALFGETVLSLSMLSDCAMLFSDPKTMEEWNIHLPRYSLLAMQGYSRNDCKHSISKNEIDFVAPDLEIPRAKRISITFRTII